MGQLIIEYAKRIVKLMSGLSLFSFGSYITIRVAIGVGAWETFQLGLSGVTGFDYGKVSVGLSLMILVIDIVFKGKIGIGTVCNALWIGTCVDIFRNHLDIIETPGNKIVALLFLLCGHVIMSVGSKIYMSSALGCGPRDTMMVIIGNKLKKTPIGLVHFLINMTVFGTGVLIGGPLGIGSVVTLTCFSTIYQTVFSILKFDPRLVEHENFEDTLRRFKEAASAKQAGIEK